MKQNKISRITRICSLGFRGLKFRILGLEPESQRAHARESLLRRKRVGVSWILIS